MIFNYLKQFSVTTPTNTNKPGNSFYPLTEEEIVNAEHQLGYAFPDQLKTFYKELGYGFLVAPENASENYDFCNVNRIIDPETLANIVLKGPDSGEIIPATYELFEPGDLPFFEIGDSTRFLLMKLNSDNPNAVWCYDIKITNSFEEFIWRLYYKKPDFYDDVITEYYQK